LNDTTDPDTAASLDAAAVRVFGLGAVLIHPEAEAIVAAGMARPGAMIMPWTDVLRLPKVWRDEPCSGCGACGILRGTAREKALLSAVDFARWLHSKVCDGTGRILEPAIE
jgi:hypothetical protein